MLFNKRILQVRFVKANDSHTPPYSAGPTLKTPQFPTAAQISAGMQETVTFLALTYVAVRAADTVLQTAKEVALITAEVKIK